MPSCWIRTTCVPVTGRTGSREVSTAIVASFVFVVRAARRRGAGARRPRRAYATGCARDDYTWPHASRAMAGRRGLRCTDPWRIMGGARAFTRSARRRETVRHDRTPEEPRLAP